MNDDKQSAPSNHERPEQPRFDPRTGLLWKNGKIWKPSRSRVAEGTDFNPLDPGEQS